MPHHRDDDGSGIAGSTPDESALDALRPGEAARAAQALVPLLAERAAQAEEDRRLTPDVVDALREAGIFRLGTPRAFGWFGAGLRTAVETCRVLARGCASASWIVAIAYGGNLFVSQFPDETREAVWSAGPDAFACGAAKPAGSVERVPGGLTLTGHWPYVSGIHHAPVVLLGFLRPRDEGEGSQEAAPQAMLAVVPRDAVDVLDTWHTAGMRGTGSDTVVAEGLHVPEAMALSFEDIVGGIGGLRRPDEPRFCISLAINLPLAGTAIGIAEGALADVVAILSGGRRLMSPLYRQAVDAPAYQLAVADAAVLIDTAHLHALRAADEIDRAAAAGVDLPLERRARLRVDTSHAIRCARSAVRLLIDAVGASALADGSRLQRAWRDLETASWHAALSPETSREVYGRVLLGAELPSSPAL